MEALVLFIIIIFFFLSQFFSGMETGFISMDRLRLEREARDDKRKKRLLDFVSEPSRFLGVTLIGNNISVVIISTLFAVYFSDRIPFFSRTLSTLLLAFLMLVFAEIVPKSLYRDNADQQVLRSFPLIYLFYLIFKPFIGLVNSINSVLAKGLGLERDNRYNYLTREELAIILSESSKDESIEQPQREMLEEVMDFNELMAKNVMTQRLEIVAIEHNTPINDVIKMAQVEGYSRYPVYDVEIDRIIGILIIYDLIKQNSSNNLKASDFVREALFVPETIDLNSLLKEMQLQRKSMAIVVDSFGGTAGLVTSEDILEELVGEIEDEYDFDDSEEMDVEKIDDNILIAKGFVDIDYLNDEFDCDLPEGDYETLAGLIIDRMMRIPVKGNKVVIRKWQMEILQATGTKVIKVKMKRVTE